MRTLHDHEVNYLNQQISVRVLDEPDHGLSGGACHHYDVVDRPIPDGCVPSEDEVLGVIKFQKGPVRPDNINGVTNESLIAIVLDRLRAYQRGSFSCRENAITIAKLEEALMWQHKRTLDRMRRGVEGRHEA